MKNINTIAEPVRVEAEEMIMWESRTKEGHKLQRVISRHDGIIYYSDNEEMGEGDWDGDPLSREEFIRTLSKTDIKKVIEFENTDAVSEPYRIKVSEILKKNCKQQKKNIEMR